MSRWLCCCRVGLLFWMCEAANAFSSTGYGMTESCGMCAIMPPEVFRYDTVGLPVPSIEIKVCFFFLFSASLRFPFGLSSYSFAFPLGFGCRLSDECSRVDM